MNKRLTKLEVNKLRDSGQCGEVFMHTKFGTFDVHNIRRFIMKHAKHFPVRRQPFNEIRWAGDHQKSGDEVMSWLESQHEIDWDRVAVLTQEELDDPIINVIDEKGDGHSFIIDGIHRMAGRRKKGLPDFPYYAFPLSFALEHFMIPAELAAAFDRPWGKTDVRNGAIVDAATGKPVNES